LIRSSGFRRLFEDEELEGSISDTDLFDEFDDFITDDDDGSDDDG